MSRDPVTIVTYDWVPEFPRGYVRDMRPRWTAEEAGIPYKIETVPLNDKTPGHLAIQPFHQVPILKDGDLTLFESGAMALHLADGQPELMPEDRTGRARVNQWVIAALNSVELPVMAWIIAAAFDKDDRAAANANDRLQPRLAQLADVLDGKDWLLGDRFSVADIIMVEVLRPAADEGALADHPVLLDYIARAKARPAFQRAHADQMAHWQAAEAERTNA
ncbi:glutathione S-transferase family protein [Paracoccus tegillarcae]|uniref:Glutathione S-transferase n=1 Tax=Paracoccus tegillarcae TaxID=1529068 RepID=A0A2K9F2G9_9RHOB|nr:glutathione S-transferase family protein [Paracoccus tegillarcae]AUH34562.1 glutathione S-transferase [Paracoccus tegillarcae]